MKNTYAIIVNHTSNEFAVTSAASEEKVLPIAFAPKTKRYAFLFSAALFLFLSLFLTGVEARAATYTVNLNSDAFDANEGNGVCDTDAAMPGDQCTLRAAIQESDSFVGADFISFALPLPSVISLNNGALEIGESVNIIGPGARALTIERSSNAAGGNFRIFEVRGSNIGVSISGVTITNGNPNSSSSNNSCSNNGGGICLVTGSLSLTDVTVRNNTATSGGGVYNSGGNLSVTGSTINNNQALGGSGGGINSSGGTTTFIANSTISNNTVSNSIVDGGGGVFNVGTTQLTSVTVSGNTSSGPSGGVRNASGTLSLRNTIIAGNTAATDSDAAGTLNSLGNNLIGISAGNNGVTNNVNGDKVGTIAAPINPLLGALQSNGGPTDTHALLQGSPAIDAGNNCVADPVPTGCLNVPLTTDQRGVGFPRRVDGDGNGTATVDIGAFEAVLIPTAAEVVTGGRILTANGKGIRNVRISVTFPSGETRETVSGESGFYQFSDLPAGETYIFSVSAKNYVFTQPTKVITITEDMQDVDFIAESIKNLKKQF